jgi:hypothetical protein
MALVQKWKANVDELHVGDNVFLIDRKMIVLAVNRDGRRVLVSGRKHSCNNCDIRWLPESRLGTRPRKLARAKIKHVNSISVDTMDGITNWIPSKIPKPTRQPPGSAGKIEILRARIAKGEQLWHADDVGWEGWNELMAEIKKENQKEKINVW